MTSKRPAAQGRILAAATEIAKEQGTAHVSLEAVAARAGVSKGGLLYHFPSKAKLLEALVEAHVAASRKTVADAVEHQGAHPNGPARAYLAAFRKECLNNESPPAGLLAAIAENPEFIDPIRRYHDETIARFKHQCDDPVLAIVAFLAIEGMRSLKLFDSPVLSADEQKSVIRYLDAAL